MNARTIRISLRARRPFEAVDYGLALAKAWRPVLLGIVATGVLGTAALVFGLSRSGIGLGPWDASETVAAVLIAIWWMKPVYDRILLAYLGLASFSGAGGTQAAGRGSGDTDIGRFLAGTGRLLGQAFTGQGLGWLWHLTLGRFDAARAFTLPVWQLEKARSPGRRQRLRVLGHQTRVYAVLTCAVFLAMEAVVTVLVVGVAYLFVPVGLVMGPGSGVSVESWIWPLAATGYGCAVVLLEPAYLASGFALYVSRRTDLEGWDLEMAFRRLAARLESAGLAPEGDAAPGWQGEPVSPQSRASARS